MNQHPQSSAEFANAEIERLYYLQAMGISTYYPRFILPGALASEACAWLQGLQEEPAESPVAVAASSSSQSAARLPDTDKAIQTKVADDKPVTSAADVASHHVTGLADAAAVAADPGKPGTLQEAGIGAAKDAVDAAMESAKGPAKQAAKEAAKEVAKEVAKEATKAAAKDAAMEPVEALQFQILMLRAGNNLAVCNQIPSLAKGALSRKEAQLLHNILRWLRCPLQTDSTARCFVWPLPGVGQGSRAMAGKSLHSFLEQAQQELGFSHLLMMGSSSIECLEEFQKDKSEHNPSWQGFNTHSLAEMLALPALKKSVYQHLLPLHAQLATASP